MPAHPRPRGPKTSRVLQEHVLDAAQSVFAREGVQGASIRAIAREVGCDPSMLYYHFESKEAMFSALLERKFGSLIPALESLSRRPLPAREKLWEVLQTLGAHVKADAGFRALVRGQIVTGAEPIKETLSHYLRKVLRILTRIFRKGVDTGELRGDLALPIVTFLFARTYMEIQDLVPVFAEKLQKMPRDKALALAERTWFDLFWRGIAASSDSQEMHP